MSDEAIDGGFKVLDGPEDAAHQAPSLAHKPSRALSHDAESGRSSGDDGPVDGIVFDDLRESPSSALAPRRY